MKRIHQNIRAVQSISFTPEGRLSLGRSYRISRRNDPWEDTKVNGNTTLWGVAAALATTALVAAAPAAVQDVSLEGETAE